MNTRVDILSRKDQVDTKKDNKNVKILKNELWKQKQVMVAEIAIFKGNQTVEETILLEEIQKNNTREQEVQRELEKDDG